MRRGEWAKDLERLRQAADDDVIAVVALMELGVPECTIYRRCRKDGPWQLLAPATVLLGNGPPSRRQRLVAALLHAGSDAMVTGLDGARMHGLRRGELADEVHVLIAAHRQVRSVRGIRVERTKRLPKSVLRDGLPVAPLDRCVLDAVRRIRDDGAIAAILTEAVQRRMVPRETLRAELDAGSRRGSGTPREVLGAIDAGVRSPAEFDVRAWWAEHPELGSMRWNVRVVDRGGRLLGIADAFDDEIGLVAQVDSTEHHFTTPDQVVETERQHRAYRSAGLHVIGIRPNRVRRDPDGLYRDVVDARRVAAALPHADVTWEPDHAGRP
ncbi:hypothetical protein [Actinomycetospora sp. CA-084318]|uniref:hypothetical protein n=1 Tax=Actinomycetospora sp. CA-084318 TaxID=3239892 RepID=UPI003D9A01EF